jgi:hypothetical protein
MLMVYSPLALVPTEMDIEAMKTLAVSMLCPPSDVTRPVITAFWACALLAVAITNKALNNARP